MGFPKKYVKLSPFHPSNQLPSAAKQTLGGVWPLLPLASQDARPHQSYMLGNRKPNLYHIHIYVSIHVTTDMIYHVLCIYIYNVYICIYIYAQQKYCNLFAFKSACFKHTICVPPAKSCHQHPKATHIDTTEDPSSSQPRDFRPSDLFLAVSYTRPEDRKLLIDKG